MFMILLLVAVFFLEIIILLYFRSQFKKMTVLFDKDKQLQEELEKNKDLQNIIEKQKENMNYDPITNVYNRQFFLQLLLEEQQRAIRTQLNFAVVIFNIDNLKFINTEYGMLVGDKVSQKFCETIKLSLRATDKLGRYSDNQFILLLTATSNLDQANIPVNRMLDMVAKIFWEDIEPGLSTVTSCGITLFRSGESIKELLSRIESITLKATKNKGHIVTE